MKLDADERYIQYPLNIIYEDGTSISIASEEELIQAYKECGTDNETTTKNHKLQSNINIKNRANYV